jgi:hypothetical protein
MGRALRMVPTRRAVLRIAFSQPHDHHQLDFLRVCSLYVFDALTHAAIGQGVFLNRNVLGSVVAMSSCRTIRKRLTKRIGQSTRSRCSNSKHCASCEYARATRRTRFERVKFSFTSQKMKKISKKLSGKGSKKHEEHGKTGAWHRLLSVLIRRKDFVLEIISAANVPKADRHSESDPYVKVQLLNSAKEPKGGVFKTVYCQDDPNPVWHTFVYETFQAGTHD